MCMIDLAARVWYHSFTSSRLIGDTQMFNRKAKQTKVANATKKFDTGRTSTRNKVNAHTEAKRQKSLFKSGATGS